MRTRSEGGDDCSAEQASRIRRDTALRNRNAQDKRLRQVVTRAETIKKAKAA